MNHVYMYICINIKHTEEAQSNYNFIYFLLNICFMNLNSGFKNNMKSLTFQVYYALP